jgi:hypothetical protein
MVQLIARRDFTLGTHRYKQGQALDIPPPYAHILTHRKLTELASADTPPPPAKRKRGRPRKVRAETPAPTPPDDDDAPLETPDSPGYGPDDPAEVPAQDDEQPPGASPPGRSTGTLRAKRRYKRRDLRAE